MAAIAQLSTVAQQIAAATLAADDSLFTPGTPLWTAANLAALARVLETPRKAKAPAISMESELRQNLATPEPHLLQLAAELLYMVLLLAWIEPAYAKRAPLHALGVAIPSPLAAALTAALDPVPPDFLHGRRTACLVLLMALQAWKQLPPTDQERLLSDAWGFKLWLWQLLPEREQPMREALLFFAHPQSFTPLLSQSHKQQAAAAYATYLSHPTSDVDQQLEQICQAYLAQHQHMPDLLHTAAPPPPSESTEQPTTPTAQPALTRRADSPHVSDLPLPHLAADLLAERIALIQQQLLIDRTTLLRIYRALVGGQHVILTGPPGTGKTLLATLLPRILWRDERTGLDGYAAEPITATEDWSVRHLLGGIVPRIHQHNGTARMLYSVQHGYLARAVLANYAGYTGDNVPASFARQPYTDPHGQRCRGCWLIIDELTRAPIDAAFGSMLTSLGGQRHPLPIPTDAGEVAVPLPRDFRIIGTMNSFDRHFLHQISEALKRRFVFIDLLPPPRHLAVAEQGIALYRALAHLHTHGMPQLALDTTTGHATLAGVVTVQREPVGDPAAALTQMWLVQPADATVAAVLDAFWASFTAIRVYRALGTAQAQAVYIALLTGYQSGFDWQTALDTALADVLADQLQLLAPDELRVLYAVFTSNDSDQAVVQVQAILHDLPPARQQAHAARLAAAAPATAPQEAHLAPLLTAPVLREVFALRSRPITLAGGLFAQRLAGFIGLGGI
ncbi:MAG: AAA domain-containing protein [Chloroflexaceae bacterium]|nr:AAA domain-containing protein [Chloroflexaceae bacterium]